MHHGWFWWIFSNTLSDCFKIKTLWNIGVQCTRRNLWDIDTKTRSPVANPLMLMQWRMQDIGYQTTHEPVDRVFSMHCALLMHLRTHYKISQARRDPDLNTKLSKQFECTTCQLKRWFRFVIALMPLNRKKHSSHIYKKGIQKN